MSLPFAIMKVLAGHLNGHATSDVLKSNLAILATSGPDWSNRMKALAAKAPNVDIFSAGYVLQDKAGWQITERGRAFLKATESANTAEVVEVVCQPPISIHLVRPQFNNGARRTDVRAITRNSRRNLGPTRKSDEFRDRMHVKP